MWLASPLLAFVFLRMFLTVIFTALYQLFKFLFEHGFLLVLCFLCFSLSLEAEFLHGFDTTLDDMKAVDGYDCIRKGFCDGSKHTVREFHGNFFDLLSLILRYLHKNIDNIRDLGAFYGCY